MVKDSNKTNRESILKQSFEAAKQFAKDFTVEDYNAVNSVLTESAKITPEGKKMLDKFAGE